jgi:integrase
MQDRTRNYADVNIRKSLLGPLEEALDSERRKLDALTKTEQQRVQDSVRLAAFESDQTKTQSSLVEIIPPKRVATGKNGRAHVTIQQETKFSASAVSNSQSTVRIAIVAPADNQMKRQRGAGSIFKNGSSTLWVKFYDRGIPRRESSHSTDPKVAEKLLKRRLAEVETKIYVPRQNIMVDEMIFDLLSDYRVNGQKSIDHAERRWRLHLMPSFSRMRAHDVTTDRVRRYINSRLEEGAENASINRELALLKRAFNLARECTPPKVKDVPYIPMLQERNTRKGFLEAEGYSRVAAGCGSIGLWMRAIFECGYTYGWRHEELLGLEVRQVSLLTNGIRLDAGATKNDDAREVCMTKTVRALLIQCVRAKKPNEGVFTRDDGRPVRDFRKSWQNVCCAAGVGEVICRECNKSVDADNHCASCGRDRACGDLKYSGLLFHDLRRTAVRNMIRAGIPERVAMQISGHLTRSVFDRYHIVAPNDLTEAARKVEIHHEREAAAQKESELPDFGQSSGRTAPKGGNLMIAPKPSLLPN